MVFAAGNDTRGDQARRRLRSRPATLVSASATAPCYTRAYSLLPYLLKGRSCLNTSRGLFSFGGRGAVFRRIARPMLALMEAPPAFQISSRCGELDVAAAFRQFFPSHPLDDWPVLPNELRRILKILRLHFDSAGLPASATRYLEIERVTRGLRIFPMRLNIPAHASPVSRRTGTSYVCKFALPATRMWRGQITEKTEEKHSRSNRHPDRTHRLTSLPAIPDLGSLGGRVINATSLFHVHTPSLLRIRVLR